jgi:hypothetical protein
MNQLSGALSDAPMIQYEVAVTNTAILVSAGPSNLYGILVENNGGGDCFLQFYDAASAGAVTVGTGEVWEVRCDEDSAFGRDPVPGPLRNFKNGIVIAVVGVRGGSSAPASPATVSIFHKPKNS